MAQPEHNPVADIYRLAEALELPLTPGDRQVLEALVRSRPQTFAGTSQALIDQAREQTSQLIEAERVRTSELLERAKVTENTLRQTTEQREALIQEWLKAQQPQASPGMPEQAERSFKEQWSEQIRQEVKAAIDVQMKELITQIESTLVQLSEQHSKRVEN